MTTETHQLDALAPYSLLRAHIETLKAENASKTFDYETTQGNKLARSHVYALRQRRADVERVRKDAKAEALEYGRKVDAAAKELTAEIDAMIAVHQAPLDAIEKREADRKAAHEANLLKLQVPEGVIVDSATCRSIRDRIAAIHVNGEWEEFKPAAVAAQATSLKVLDARLAELERMEAEQAELAKLRREAAERAEKEAAERRAREQAEREERIRREAEEKARREAEEAAERQRKADADKALEEARRKEREAQAAIEAERRKADEARLEAERVKREAAEAEARKAREEEAARKAQAAREADIAHRLIALDEAAAAIAAVSVLSDEAALALAVAIADGRIPNVTMKF